MSVVEWEWRQESPGTHDCGLETIKEVWGAYAMGVLVSIVALSDPSAEDLKDGYRALWWHYTVPRPEVDGIYGYEQIEGYETLEEAKAAVEGERDQLIEMIKEEERDVE